MDQPLDQATCSPKLRGLCGNFSSCDNEGSANGAFESDNGNSTDDARHGSAYRQGDQDWNASWNTYEIHHLYIYKYVLQHCSFCSIYLKICFIDFDWTGWLQLSICSSINVFPQSNAWSFSVAHSCALEEWSVVKEKNQWTLFRNTLVFTPENCLCLSMQSQRVCGLTPWPYSQKGFKSAATSGWGIAFPLEEPRLFSTHMALDVGCFGQQGVCAWWCIVLSLCQGCNQPTAGFQGHWHLVASASNIKRGTKEKGQTFSPTKEDNCEVES